MTSDRKATNDVDESMSNLVSSLKREYSRLTDGDESEFLNAIIETLEERTKKSSSPIDEKLHAIDADIENLCRAIAYMSQVAAIFSKCDTKRVKDHAPWSKVNTLAWELYNYTTGIEHDLNDVEPTPELKDTLF